MRDVIETVTVRAESNESLRVVLEASIDPTGTPPEFALSGLNAPSSGGVWVAGEWDAASPWDAATLEVAALTPRLGAGQPLVLVSGMKYSLWAKLSAGSEDPAQPVGIVICP